jgi:O-acetyl-ADP-ribose deacetylase
VASAPDRVVVAVRGDLTSQRVDAVVNAANEHLAHGGGVAAALSRAAGPTLQKESDQWVEKHGPVGPGIAAVTGGGRLVARWVVHVVGPRYRPGQDNPGLLTQAVEAALDAAAGVGARSVALPAISAGIFGYPRPEACAVIARTASDWVGRNPGMLDEVRLVGWDDSTTADFVAGLEGRQ